jgi:hypothetical protein
MALYELFVKENEKFTYEAVDKILIRHENSVDLILTGIEAMIFTE